MKTKIKTYFENLNPNKLGFKEKIKVGKIERLGKGLSSLNYVISVKDKKFTFRLKADGNIKLAKEEFENLRFFENHDFAPNVYLFDDSKKDFESPILILNYLDGKVIEDVNEFEKNQIEELAEFLTKIHLIKIIPEMQRLPKKNYFGMLKRSMCYKEEFEIICKDEDFIKQMDITFSNLLKMYDDFNYFSEMVLAHGDFNSQNVLVKNGEYFVIDFEDLELSDPACEIAHIFIDFGKLFDAKNKEIFLNKYLELKDEKNLEERVEKYILLWYLGGMYWRLSQVHKTLKKSFSKEYQEEEDLKRDILNATSRLKQIIDIGAMPKSILDFDLTKIFKD